MPFQEQKERLLKLKERNKNDNSSLVQLRMVVSVYNQDGKKVGQERLPPEIFDMEFNPALVHQVILAQRANRRQAIAHTKTRAEVRGGGRKPWRQKGTGRARHGSIRSPLWIGGGVSFGPRNERIFQQKINKKMRRKALCMVLSAKLRDNEVVLLDELTLERPKTRLMAQLLQKLPVKNSSCIIALPAYDKNLMQASRNIPRVHFIQAKDLNVLDVLSYKYLLLPKEAIKVIEKTLAEGEAKIKAGGGNQQKDKQYHEKPKAK